MKKLTQARIKEILNDFCDNYLTSAFDEGFMETTFECEEEMIDDDSDRMKECLIGNYLLWYGYDYLLQENDAYPTKEDLINKYLTKKRGTMKVKIMQRSVYHKYAEVEIEIPNDWNDKDGVENYYDEHINDYLHDNEHLYVDKIDKAMSEASFEYGNGVNDYTGMNEPLSESEWRFEYGDDHIVFYGGHL